MKISIIIPNFNGEKLLRKNLPAVLEVEGTEEIIVVDDGSSDGSVETIKNVIRQLAEKIKKTRLKLATPVKRDTKQKIKIVENEKNLGFASAINRGIKEAEGEVVVLLNTDVSPKPDFLKPLISHFSNPQVFGVGCLDKSIENGEIILRGRGIGKWEKGFLVHQRGEVNDRSTLWVSGGSGAFRKDGWEKLGGLDELYNPFYWEDIDLSYRAQKAGYKVLFEPKSVVVHQHEEGVIRQKYTDDQIKTIAYRNQFIFIWKNIDDPGFLLDHILWLPYWFLKGFSSFDFAFLKGFFLALSKFPQILKTRRNLKNLFVKSDREILANFS